MGWGDLVQGGLDIVELPVNPHAMLVEPYVGTLAEQLRKRILPDAPVAGETMAGSPSSPQPAPVIHRAI